MYTIYSNPLQMVHLYPAWSVPGLNYVTSKYILRLEAFYNIDHIFFDPGRNFYLQVRSVL